MRVAVVTLGFFMSMMLADSSNTVFGAIPKGIRDRSAMLATSTETVFTPVADAYVTSAASDQNYGSKSTLRADGSPDTRIYLRFDVQGFSGPITRATLRAYATSSLTAGYEVRAVSENDWNENDITYKNAPKVSGTVTDNSGEVRAGSWTSVDVTPLIGGTAPRSLALTNASSTALALASRESGANAPQLVVETGTTGATSTPTSSATTTATPTKTATPTSGSSGAPILVAAGDIASCNSSGDEATANLLDDIFASGRAGVVALLGDIVYESGTSSQFTNCFDPSWGRHKARTRPAPGNHEYLTNDASGYYGYFGAEAGDPAKGYYSYNLGSWHILALNSNCSKVGGCRAGSPQEQWVRADLAEYPASCTLAYWHHPSFSSGQHGSSTAMQAIWQALQEYGVEVALTGHDHSYERFAPQTASGAADSARGIRQFVVGTGGKNHYPFSGAPLSNSEVRNADTFGVLQLTLRPTGYDWQFVPEAGKSFTDAGSSSCR